MDRGDTIRVNSGPWQGAIGTIELIEPTDTAAMYTIDSQGRRFRTHSSKVNLFGIVKPLPAYEELFL